MGEPSAAVLRAVEDLRSASSAISNFINTWDDLRNLLNFINSSIDSFSAELDTTDGALPQLSATEIPQPEATESDKEDDCESRASAASNERDDNQEVSKPDEEPKRNPNGKEDGDINMSKPDGEPKRNPNGKKKPLSEIESICNTASATAGKRLRKYVVARLHNGISKMYDEVPAALARSPDPAALVFACLGAFYKQGSRTFGQDRCHAAFRRAAILVLEFFVLSGRVVPSDQLAPNLLKEANVAASTWKDRMVHEGGVSKAGTVDALGLLLLLASFGIPPQFGDDNIASLIRLCNPKTKARVLRQSPILVPKVTEMIKDMVKDAKYLAAAELVTTFELQEEFPLLPLLSSYMDAIKREGVDEQTEGQLTLISTKAACEKQLKELQALAKFLNAHDLHAEYASFEVDATISKLKKDLLNFNEKTQNLNAKGKPEESVPMEGAETRSKHQNVNGVSTEENAQLERSNTQSKPKVVDSKRKMKGSTPLKIAETGSKPPQNLSAKRKDEETAQLQRPAIHSKPKIVNTKRKTKVSTQLKGAETSSKPPQNLNAKRKAEDSVPLERADKGPKTLQKLNAKRKDEETASLEIVDTLSRPPSSQMNTTFENSVSFNMRDSASQRRTSLEHPSSVPVPMNMQMNNGPPSTSTLGVSYSGMDRRFPGLLNHDIPVLPARKNSHGFPENGERDYVLPSANHDSRMYDCFRDSCSYGPTTSDAFGLLQPSPGNAGQYLGAHAGVEHVSAWQSTAHAPPHGTESRASGSASRYSFADMV